MRLCNRTRTILQYRLYASYFFPHFLWFAPFYLPHPCSKLEFQVYLAFQIYKTRTVPRWVGRRNFFRPVRTFVLINTVDLSALVPTQNEIINERETLQHFKIGLENLHRRKSDVACDGGAQCITLATSLRTRPLRILNTSAFRGCKPEDFWRNSEKIRFTHAFQKRLAKAQWTPLTNDTVVRFKCILGDVWGKVTAE